MRTSGCSPADRAFPIPDGIDDETAAAAMLKGMTVYYLIFETHRLVAGESALWHAAAGGVGLIGTQWSKALGATVYGTAGSDEKLAIARQNGCDAVINYKTEDFPSRIKDLTEGRGVDVVYDGVGKVTFEPSLDCLRPRGLMVSFGNASGYVTIPNLGILASKGSLYVTRPTTASYFVKTEDLRKAAAALFDVIASGKVKVTINQRFKLEDVPEAHRALEARETIGSTACRGRVEPKAGPPHCICIKCEAFTCTPPTASQTRAWPSSSTWPNPPTCFSTWSTIA
jgi:NADPH2:quinone reductase